MLDCDRKLESLIAALTDKGAKTSVSSPAAGEDEASQHAVVRCRGRAVRRPRRRSDRDPRLGSLLALKLVGECGTSAWPTAKHFTSWLCLAPGNKISGGKVLSSRTRRSSSRAAALLRLAATSIGRSETALGAFYRRLSARAGKAKAVTATARKIAVLFYNALSWHDLWGPGRRPL